MYFIVDTETDVFKTDVLAWTVSFLGVNVTFF